MNTFQLILQSATQYEAISNVVSFVGSDSSGSFDILASHARMMTCLAYGLSWFRYSDGTVEYVALPGALLYFVDNTLSISTRHYLRNPDYHTIVDALDHELHTEEEELRSVKDSLQQLDTEMLKHLWELKRKYQYGTK